MNKKFVSILGMLAVSAVSLVAETLSDGDLKMRLKASRDGSQYKQGEPAEFLLEVSRSDKPQAGIRFWSSVSKDGINPTLNDCGITDKNGKAVIKAGTLKEPGVLRCSVGVYNPDTKKETQLMAGAAFELDKIRPGLPVPADFAEYWKAQKRMLSEIPMNVDMKEVPCDNKNVELFDIKADTFKGFLTGYYARPKGAKPKSCPAILFPHGAGVRSSNKGGPVAWAAQGYIALDYNAHGIPNGKPKEFYESLAKNELKDYRYVGADNRDNSFFRVLYLRTMRALEFLMDQPEWDGKILIVNGTSQGGGQALAAGGLCDKVTYVAAFVPAMCDHNGIAARRVCGWPNLLRPDKFGAYDKSVYEASPYFDAANFASMIKGEAFVTTGLRDNVCPPSSVSAAYSNIKSPKTFRIAEEGSHAVPRDFYDEGANRIREHVKKMRSK